MGGGVAFVGGAEFEQPSPNPNWTIGLAAWLTDVVQSRDAKKLMLADYGDFRASVTDDDIPRLVQNVNAMPELTEVRIRNTGITPEGAARLRRELPGLLISLWSTKPSAVQGEHRTPTQMLGRWSVLEIQNQGISMPSEIQSDIEFTETQAKLRLDIRTSGPTQVFDCFVVPGKDPLKLDLKPTGNLPGTEMSRHLRAIYRIKGDTLWICLEGRKARHRPIEFVW